MARKNKKMNKKAISAYISWVLIVAFSVSLGVIIYGWITEQTVKSARQIEQNANNDVCQSLGINIEAACQNTQVLYMNISNINLITVDALVIRLYDIYQNPQITEHNISIRPQDSQNLVLLKPGTIGQIEVVPIIRISNQKVICSNSMITMKRVEQCQS